MMHMYCENCKEVLKKVEILNGMKVCVPCLNKNRCKRNKGCWNNTTGRVAE